MAALSDCQVANRWSNRLADEVAGGMICAGIPPEVAQELVYPLWKEEWSRIIRLIEAGRWLH